MSHCTFPSQLPCCCQHCKASHDMVFPIPTTQHCKEDTPQPLAVKWMHMLSTYNASLCTHVHLHGSVHYHAMGRRAQYNHLQPALAAPTQYTCLDQFAGTP